MWNHRFLLCFDRARARRATMHDFIQDRQHNQDQHRRSQHTTHHHPGQRLLCLRADPCGQRCRKQPDGRGERGHENGTHLHIRPLQDGLSQIEPMPTKILNA